MKMDWLERMNSVIEYIESNIDQEATVIEASRIAGCSVFHFQKMFFAISGITPAEYIRRRRLTLAAKDLASGNEKVIDIALKYGYESPNAFTRAFRNMHGINPREVRSTSAKMSAFNRISFHVEVNGGNEMEYRIIEKPAFFVVGKSKEFTHENFFREGPSFWKEYVTTEEYQNLWDLTNGRWGAVSDAPLMSLYLPNQNRHRDSFLDILAVELDSGVDNKRFKKFSIPEATYAEFKCTYQSSVKMNKYIYGEWLPSTGFVRDEDKPDIAAYFPVAFMSTKGMSVRWWIPIVKNK